MIRKIEKSRGKKWAALVAVSVFSLLGLGGIADAQIMRIGPAPIEPAPGTYKPAKEDGGTIDKGKTVYFKKCVWCHGPDGGRRWTFCNSSRHKTQKLQCGHL